MAFMLLLICALTLVSLSQPSNAGHADETAINSTQTINTPPPIWILSPNHSDTDLALSPTPTATFNNIQQQPAKHWAPYDGTYINMGFVSHSIWIKFPIPRVNKSDTLLLEFDNSQIDVIELVVLDESAPEEENKVHVKANVTDTTPLDQRLVPLSQYVFPLKIEPDQQLVAYVKVTNSLPMKLPIYVWEQKTFSEKRIKQTLFNGLYFGAVLIMALYNLCLFFFIKDRSYANYVIFITLVAGFIAVDKGLATDFLWPDMPECSHQIYTSLLALGILASARFTMSFLSLKQQAPRIYQGMNYLSLTWVAIFVLSLISDSPTVLLLAFTVVVPGGMSLLLTGMYMWRKGMPEAAFFTIAWFTLVNAALIYIISLAGLIPYYPILDSVVQISSIIEAALLSLGLAYRINTLNNEKQMAFTSAQAKSDLLATVSHEIRTPMNGILGMTQLLKDTPLSSQQSHYLKTILGSGQTLLTILNDILDHSKIEAGKLDLESIRFNIRLAIDETATIFATSAADKQLYFSIHMDPDVPSSIEGDPTRVKQVLTNLLNNAFKFTDSGEVIVRVKIQAAGGTDTDMLLIEIEDQGIGISENKLNHLFENFVQGETSTSREYGGTGLGLSISKRLTEMMGGEIGVRSQAGQGSVFWFTVPIKQAQHYQVTQKEVLIHKLSQLNSLVISSTPDFVAMLNQYADIWGMTLKHANTLQAAQQITDAQQQDFQFVLIECTQKLPANQELINWLNTDNHLKHAQLVISASAGSTDFTTAFSTNKVAINDKAPWFIEQPFSINKLFYLISNSMIEYTPSHTLTDTQSPYQNRMALVVDDNAVNRKVALALLTKLGINVITANNGQEAFDYVTATNNVVDLILMDCEMPEVNGFQSSRMIRDWEQKNNIDRHTIVALSAHAMENYKVECIQSGMDDFIAKPVMLDNLRQTLNKYLT